MVLLRGMSEKVIGYILLTIGFLVLIFSAFNVYQVFTGQIKPVQLFNFEGISLNLGNMLGTGEGMTAEQQIALNQQKAQIAPQELISSDLLNESSNLAAHLFLMGFMASIGYKIGSLGIQMLRPIVVKVREAKQSSILDPK